MKYITKTILYLSLVSLFTDIASEMLYPVIPLYLNNIGFTVILIGVLEGAAEAISGLSKGYFGSLSDKTGSRLKFVRLGYGLSAISKPLMALTIIPAYVFAARTLDRFGKGIRTAPRDAMLSDETTNENKGKVFGFHRSLDTLGAVIGPSVALVFLYFYPNDYRTLFFYALIPGIISIAITFIIREKKREPNKKKSKYSFYNFISYFPKSSLLYKKVTTGLLIFSLFNSSDVFLLLMLKFKGFNDTHIILIYIFYNIFYAVMSYPFGFLADKIGFRKTIVSGLLMFSFVYFIMAISSNLYIILSAFVIYGSYAAATDGVSKAWISNITQKTETGTAIGTYTAFNSIAVMLASFTGGLIWYNFTPTSLFLFSAIGAISIAIYFLAGNFGSEEKAE